MSYKFEERDVADIENTYKENTDFYVDPKLLIPRPDNVITCRILSFFVEGSDRKLPYIVKYNHGFYEKNPETGLLENDFCTCPTSPYFWGIIEKPFDKCKACTRTGQLWNEMNGTKDTPPASPERKAILRKEYEKYKRRYCFFVPVAIINDKLNPENNFKVKILCLTNKQEGEDLRTQIIHHSKNKNLIFNNLGSIDALNLVITTTVAVGLNNKKYRANKFEFTKTTRTFVNANNEAEKQAFIEKFYEKNIKPLEFDKHFYTEVDYDKISAICKKIESTKAPTKKPTVQKPIESVSESKTKVDESSRKSNLKEIEEITQSIITKSPEAPVQDLTEKVAVRENKGEAVVDSDMIDEIEKEIANLKKGMTG